MKHLTGIVFCISLCCLATSAKAQVVAHAGSDRDFCIGDTVQLNGSCSGASGPCTYQWSPSAGLSDSTIANPVATPNFPTCYVLTVFDGGQPGTPDTVCVTPHTIPTVEGGPDHDFCLGDSVLLDGQAGGDSTALFYSFLWTPGASLNNDTLEDPTAFPGNSTTYYVTATSNWGCQSPLDSTNVFMRPSPQAEAGPNLTICEGNAIQLDGGFFYTVGPQGNPNDIRYAWTPGQTLSDSTVEDPLAAPPATQWYYLTVSLQICSSTDSVLVTVFPSLNPTISQSVNTLTANHSGSAPDFQWYLNGMAINGAQSQTYTVTQAGCYQVEITEGPCSTLSDSVCTTVGLPEIAGVQRMTVFPNPARDRLWVDLDVARGMEVLPVLRNATGQVVWSGKRRRLGTGTHQMALQIGSLPNGIYLLSLGTGKSDQGIQILIRR